MDKKLDFKDKFFYSTGSIGLNLVSVGVASWLMFFYMPPGGTPRVSPGFLSLIFLIAGLWDGLVDPFLGHWSDNTRTRWGRRKPFLLFGTPLMAVFMILLWLPPVKGTSVLNGIYLFVFLLLYHTSFSAVGMPYDGSLAEMAPEIDERVRLSSWKMVFGIVGFVIGTLTVPLLYERLGGFRMGLVAGAIAVLTMYLAMSVLRESEKGLSQERIDIVKAVVSTVKNRHFLFFFAATILLHVTYQLLLSVSPYFVTQVIGGSEGDVTLFQGGMVALMLLSIPLWYGLRRLFKDKWVITIAMTLLALVTAAVFFIKPIGERAILPGLIPFILTGIPMGGYLIMAYAMMGNVVDYDETRTGMRREAIYYGTFSLATNAGSAISLFLIPVFLKALGDTAANPLGIRTIFLVAGGFALLGALVFLGYNLENQVSEQKTF
jgi:GPH family glycoside/pentoside/hexuronide:cation symporter